MADLGTPSHNPGFDETQPKVEAIQPAQERKTGLPKHIQTQIDEAINQTQEQKETELKVNAVFQALEEKFGSDFDRSKFNIKKSGLGEKDLNYLGYGVFLLYSKEGKLLSYIKDNGATILDMTSFNPYMDSFEENMMKHIGITMGIGNDGKWYVKFGIGKWHESKEGQKHKKEEEEIIIEGSEEFDRYIIGKYILKE